MKVKNIKKALSLFLAVLMIALALPLTMLPVAAEETTNTTATTIKYAKLFAKYSDGYDVHAQYGSVAAMIDGDPAPGYIDEDGQGDEDRTEYTYYQSDNLYDGIMYYYLDSEKKLALDTDGNNEVYMGYAVFELNGLSAIEDVTVWLAGDNATEWKTPETVWNMNDDYDILVSNDGETWNLLQSFTDMCGDGTNPGANFPAEGDDARAVGTDGKLGHKIALDGAEAKYFAIGVKSGMNSTNTTGARNAIVFGEVTVNGTVITPDATKKSPAEIYAEAKDGDLLKTVNFNDMSWSDDYVNSDNWNTYAYVSEDGRTVKHLIHGSKTFGTNLKRAMWGGIAEEERFSLDDGNKYTIYFDAKFGNNAYNKYGIGIQVDGNNTLVIDSFGCCYWYNWNTQKVNKSDEDNRKWNTVPDPDLVKTEQQSFAVEVDSVNNIMTLYVAQSDGTYVQVRGMTYNGADISGSLICRIYTRNINGTPDNTYWSEVSNVQIYKGLVGGDELKEIDRVAEYANAKEGDLLQTLNFNELYWENDFYDTNNNGADAKVSADGSMARLTLIEGKAYNRAIWGGIKEAYRFPLREVTETIENPDDPDNPTYVYGKSNTYTLVFDLEFGNTAYYRYGLGIQVDGNHTLLIDGFGCNYLYKWNDVKVNKSDEGDDKWNYHTDIAKAEKHTFAVEVDPQNNEMTLYIASADGTFEKVRTVTYDGAAIGNTLNPRIYTRKLDDKYASDANSWTEVSDVKIYKGLVAGQVQNVTGASVRLSNPTGIRFSSEFRKSMIDSLRATYGEGNVNLGMIIAPTDYLTDTGVEFEMEALDACDELPEIRYVKVDAKTIHEDGAYYTINCALANVHEGNYNRRFSARAFIEVNGEVYKYADFNLENNSRSIAEVSRAAYGDLSDTKDSVDGGLKYSYEVTVGETVKYSPYTTEERNTLYNFFGLDASSITVMTYNLEYKNSDSSGGWEGRNPASAIGTIVTADPDVVGLQEDTADWDSSVAELKNNGYKSVSSNYSSWKTWGNGWAKNDIYYKEDKFEIVNNFYGFMSFKDLDKEYTIEGYENVDMSIDVQGDAEGWFSDVDIGRTFSYVALKDKTSGKIILVVNTHLHYGDGTSSSDTNCDDDHILREYQSRLLAAWLEDQKATYSTQVVMGDMNAHTTSTNGKKVLSGYSDSGLSFARDEALVKGDVGGTLDGTDYTVRQNYIFDHVLYRNATAVEYTVIDNKVDADNTRYPSDHLPVYAKLIWN